MTEEVVLTNIPGERVVLKIKQGATYGPVSFAFTEGGPVDISAWVFRGHVRKTADSPTIAASITTTITDGPNGAGNWRILASATAGLTCHATDIDHEDSAYVFDYEAEKPDGTVVTLLDGDVKVWREVTRV